MSVDGPGTNGADGLADVVGVEAAGQDQWAIGRHLCCDRPVDAMSHAAALLGFCIEHRDGVGRAIDLAAYRVGVHLVCDVNDANDGTADPSGERRMFAAAELDQIEIDLVEHPLDFVDRLSGEDPDQQRLIGCVALTLDRVRGCFGDLDPGTQLASDGSCDLHVDSPRGVGEDHADFIGAGFSRPDGVFDRAN